MIRQMEWSEISGIDWGAEHADSSQALWTVPADKTKQELHLHSDEAFNHPEPLSSHAV